jgi:mannose-6-phosphate isomerase-like protein (cupin superfamily)
VYAQNQSSEKFDLIHDHWNPRIAGELNGQQVKLVKFKGEFIWHKHDDEDEMFFVVQGEFDMHLREKIITIGKMNSLLSPKE